MKRFKHSLSNYKLATFDMGELVPVGITEVLPGDSVQQSTSMLLRVSPVLAPVMHPVSVRIHHWFVPNRLVWDGWEDFITGGDDGEGGDSGLFPYVDSGAGFSKGTLGDYFGLPTGVASLQVSALPFRAYNLIYNEFYRDQDLVSEVAWSSASGLDSTTSKVLQKCAWEKDYLAGARPWPQKGPEITLPLGGSAPVKGIGVGAVANAALGGTFYETDGTTIPSGARAWSTGATPIVIEDAINAAGTAGVGGHQPNIYADLAGATSASVNDLRLALALQRYQEMRARFGSRYSEYLRYLGVRSSDARLQRPEYLGGGKQNISWSEVLQTGPDSDNSGVADLKGHGIAAMRSRRYRRFFEEHGYIITVASVRPRSIYTNGIHKTWLRRVKEDFWQKELEHIGQQEVDNKEVYVGAGSVAGVFGYQDRYAEYRSIPSHVTGDFRDTLNFWHQARIFSSQPVLNASFVNCDPTKRINAVQTEDVLWCMINHSIQARRLVNRFASPKIL